MNQSTVTCCVCFVNIVLPTQSELSTCDAEKIKKFYGAFTRTTVPIIGKYQGNVRKFVGEGLESFFPQTSDYHNVTAIKNVVECCIALIERQNGLLDEMKDVGIPDVGYKIGVDYETLILSGNLILDKPPVWSSAFEICEKTPPDGILLGEDLVKIITNLPELKSRYYFEKMGEYQIQEKRNNYKVFSLNRQI